jgi:hypothetical protein
MLVRSYPKSPAAGRVRAFQRRALTSLVAHDARLHLIGLGWQLWCADVREPTYLGWVVKEDAAKV